MQDKCVIHPKDMNWIISNLSKRLSTFQSYFLMLYITTTSGAHFTRRRIIASLMNNTFGSMWKDVVVPTEGSNPEFACRERLTLLKPQSLL